jgi:hypothetical protein
LINTVAGVKVGEEQKARAAAEGELAKVQGMRAEADADGAAADASLDEALREVERLKTALQEAERLAESVAEAHEEALAGARREVEEAGSMQDLAADGLERETARAVQLEKALDAANAEGARLVTQVRERVCVCERERE